MSQNSDQSNDPETPQRVSLFGRRARSPAAIEPPAPPPPPEPKPRKRRRSGFSMLSGVLSFVLIAALIAIGGYGWALYQARKPGPLTADKVVQLVREDDGGPLADQLEHAGVIDSAFWFTLLTFIDGSHSALKRGEFQFKQQASLTDVEHVLTSGVPVQHALTIPEGLTSEQVVQRVRDADFLAGDVKEIPREGSILPQTYDFPRGYSRQAALTRMEKEQSKAVDDIWKKRASDLPIKSPGELVTLASIVEKETGKPDERPRVAGVFVNRLQKHMKLQSDPTIVYGLVFGKGTLGHSISKAELDQATPYNTYIIDGLPPGPISNPGKATLEAVANPTKSKELYFVADGTGGHAFAETLDQHQKNVLRWRQIEKDAKDRVAPDATPLPGASPTVQIHGALESPDPQALGALNSPPAGGDANPPDGRLPVVSGQKRGVVDLAAFGVLAAPARASANPALAAKLAKYGAQRLASAALLAPTGPLAGVAKGLKSLEDVGAVVQGVNDIADDSLVPAEDMGPSGAPVTAYPMSPAALADQKAREARYGTPDKSAGPANPADLQVALSASAPAPVASPASGARPRAFDASEGTPLDPLLNKTYDLSTAKTIPALK